VEAREAAGRRRGGQAARAPAARGRAGGKWARVSWLLLWHALAVQETRLNAGTLGGRC